MHSLKVLDYEVVEEEGCGMCFKDRVSVFSEMERTSAEFNGGDVETSVQIFTSVAFRSFPVNLVRGVIHKVRAKKK